MKILGRVPRFGDPESADIVIFDECNSHLVRRALNTKYSVAVLKMRPEEIWIGLRVAIYFCRFLGQFKFRDAVKHRCGLAIGILKQLQCIYLESCLVVMKPKAVVTYIDNCSRFGWIAKNCRRFPFFAIQNGSRLRYAANTNSGYYSQHLFCYGEHERNLFPQLGYHVENFYPVGSLVASLYFDRQVASLDEKYDLLIVSTWRGNIGFQQDVKDTMRSMKIMDQHLAKYIKSTGIKAAIILRAERGSEHWEMPEIGSNEEDYYREIYADCAEIVESDFSKRNIFPLMQQSRVIVSCLSSALMEALGIGKKVLYCNFTGTDLYHKDFDSLIVTSDANYEAFTTKLDELIKMPQAEYLQCYKECKSYYMSNPDDKTTYQAIAEKIDEIIEMNE